MEGGSHPHSLALKRPSRQNQVPLLLAINGSTELGYWKEVRTFIDTNDSSLPHKSLSYDRHSPPNAGTSTAPSPFIRACNFRGTIVYPFSRLSRCPPSLVQLLRPCQTPCPGTTQTQPDQSAAGLGHGSGSGFSLLLQPLLPASPGRVGEGKR